MKQLSLILFLLSTLSFLSASALAEETSTENKFYMSVDLYGSHTHLMPYKGYQDDANATVYLNYSNWILKPFVRYLDSNYHYLNENTPPNNTIYTDDRRTASGFGLDLILGPYLKLRFVNDYVTNKISNQSYMQESLGLIYNQYIDFENFELNNYAESFLIPRLSSSRLDTYLRVQALKTFFITRSENTFNGVFPFAQYKMKVNDDATFGITGSNISVGLGYKYYGDFNPNKFSLLLELHSVVYQSSNFNSDWTQLNAAVQYMYK